LPFVTVRMGGNLFESAPGALYGVVLLMAALAYCVPQAVIIRSQGGHLKLRRAVGRELKDRISHVLYAIAIALPLVRRWLRVSLVWRGSFRTPGSRRD